MKIISSLCIAIIIFASSPLRAEAIAPQLVISGMIEALKKNNTNDLSKFVDLDKVKNLPRHGFTVEKLRIVFAGIDMSEIEYSKPVYDEISKTISVRMNKPISMDFDLQHQNAIAMSQDATLEKGDFYLIIGIHP